MMEFEIISKMRSVDFGISGFICTFKETLTNTALTSISFKAKTQIKLQSTKNEVEFVPVFFFVF